MISKINAVGILLSLFLLTNVCSYGGTEFVTLIKVMDNDDMGLVQRANGEVWLIEKGVGALSFWRFEGKKILITSPGMFCGVGAKVILPDVSQEAKIWNAEFVQNSEVSLNGNSQAAKSGDPITIEAQIDGDFEGFDGETIFKLTNGQIWQQSEYYYYYHYSFMPQVTILQSGPSFKILVEGVPKAVGVERLK